MSGVCHFLPVLFHLAFILHIHPHCQMTGTPFVSLNNIPLHRTYHVFLSIYPPNELLSWFFFLTLCDEQATDFNSFEYIPRSRIAGSYGNSIFNCFLEPTDWFPCWLTNLHFSLTMYKVAFSPYHWDSFVILPQPRIT